MDTKVLMEGQDIPLEDRVGFWVRLGAYMIDFAFVLIFGIGVGVVIGDDLAPFLFGDQLNQMDAAAPVFGERFVNIFRRMMEIAAGTSIVGLVPIVLEATLGQSVGKMLLKIKNTNLDGTPASPQKLWTRAMLKYGASILSLIGSITALWAITMLASLMSLAVFVGFFLIFMDGKQALHDMIAKTIVSKV